MNITPITQQENKVTQLLDISTMSPFPEQSGNDILFIGATHGHEEIGVQALQQLQIERGQKEFDWIIGNPPALKQGEREYEGDLNRSAPGKLDSEQYAERRAAQLIQIADQYTYTIDIHGSTKENGIFIIITRLTKKNLQLASLFDIDRIVYWPALVPEMEGPVSEYMQRGIEIECGVKTDPAVQRELKRVLRDFLDNREERELLSEDEWKASLEAKELYEFTSVLSTKKTGNVELQEFTKTTVTGVELYPVFVGSYSYTDHRGYGLEKRSIEELLESAE